MNNLNENQEINNILMFLKATKLQTTKFHSNKNFRVYLHVNIEEKNKIMVYF